MRKFFITIGLVSYAWLSATTSAQAGTAAYYGKCYFLDRGNNQGGNIIQMPCFVVEGANMSSSFVHILWKDGVKTRLNARPDKPLQDASTKREYIGAHRMTFIAKDDGDVIFVDETTYTNDRLDFDDPGSLKKIR